MKHIQLNDSLTLSSVIHGYWRLLAWKLNDKQLAQLIQEITELGITSFDHADIYGDYTCEKLFGDALALLPAMRQKIEIITKCGIARLSATYPERKVKHYDYSKNYIITSVENSLRHLRTDYIDVLLLHRPSPFFNPQEVAAAFYALRQSGKVLHFGVSNFNPTQYELLDSVLDHKLVTNQIQVSANHLEHFEKGTIDYLQTKQVTPMAWSPLGGGKIHHPTNEQEVRVLNAVQKVADDLNLPNIDLVLYSWLFKHPSSIIPIVGSSKIERIKIAKDALAIDMSLEQWFSIYIAALGKELP